MAKKTEQFNMVIVGVGGQGLITLLKIISEAAMSEGYDIRTSELHGLSQRGGSVEVHIRFGKKIDSPLVGRAKAELVLGLEEQEILNGIYFANEKTCFLINQYILPVPLKRILSEKEIIKELKKISKNIITVPADKICKEKLGTNVVAGIYLISFAVLKNVLPLRSESIEKAIREIIPEKYLDLNLKAFELAKN
jgi:indolepyruvate ferredoxin oxidoreductase, beta subunit